MLRVKNFVHNSLHSLCFCVSSVPNHNILQKDGTGNIKHCHDNSRAQEDRETERKVARKRLYLVSVICLIFMIGEILGESRSFSAFILWWFFCSHFLGAYPMMTADICVLFVSQQYTLPFLLFSVTSDHLSSFTPRTSLSSHLSVLSQLSHTHLWPPYLFFLNYIYILYPYKCKSDIAALIYQVVNPFH